MSQRQLVESSVQQRLIQGTPAHFRTHGAGILLLTVIENNRADLGFYQVERHIQISAQLRNPAVVHPKTHIHRDCLKGKGIVIVPTQLS